MSYVFFCFLMSLLQQRSTLTYTLFPDTTLFRSIACGTRYVGHPIPINALLIFHSRCFQRLFQPDIPILRCNIHPVRRFEFPAPTLFGYPQNDVGAFGPETLDIALELAILIVRSEEHTSELQSLMRISYPVFCLK